MSTITTKRGRDFYNKFSGKYIMTQKQAEDAARYLEWWENHCQVCGAKFNQASIEGGRCLNNTADFDFCGYMIGVIHPDQWFQKWHMAFGIRPV